MRALRPPTAAASARRGRTGGGRPARSGGPGARPRGLRRRVPPRRALQLRPRRTPTRCGRSTSRARACCSTPQRAARERRRIVHTSSCGTCGPVAGRAATEDDTPPEWELSVPYKRTKLEGERLAMRAAKQGLDVVVVNPTTPVGPGDRRPTPTGKMVADVAHGRARAHLAGGALNVVAVEDVAAGHLLAHERGRLGERYLLGGENLSMREVFAIVASAAGRRAAEDRCPVAARARRGPGGRRGARGDRAKAVAPRSRRGSAGPPADDLRRFEGPAGARISLPAGGRGAGRRRPRRARRIARRF